MAFRMAEPGTIFNLLFEKHLKQDNGNFVVEIQDGIVKMLEHKKAAFYYVTESIHSNDEYRCRVTAPFVSKYPSHLGMALKHESPYYEFLQHFILGLYEKGAFNVLRSRWNKGEPECSENNAVAMGLEKTVSLFSLLGMGAILALFAFIFEVLFGITTDGEEKKKLIDIRVGEIFGNVMKGQDKYRTIKDLEELIILLKAQK